MSDGGNVGAYPASASSPNSCQTAEVEDTAEEEPQGPPQILSAPPPRNPAETIAANDFALIYRSIFTLTPPGKHLLPHLQHVNCNYLSTPGLAPTLLQLKQHAQSLIILIKSITVSSTPALLDNANSGIYGAPSFNDGETFDFLNDLTRPYEGPDTETLRHHHELPLLSLLNTLQEKNITPDGSTPEKIIFRDICPLHHSEKSPPNSASLPYATHQALISHANEVLELLDHEYSAKGGLLSILPPASQTEDREKAETTLLGQLILYMQKLVQRLHDLERLYANALDIIAGEAVVPSQALSALGLNGRRGRELVYPQDRFVLCNAGNDLWQHLDHEFEKQGRVDEAITLDYQRAGVVGEALRNRKGGAELEKGITALDITTRYYRLKNDPLKTIFIIPAHQKHPGVSATIKIEKQPTVISVVKPVWPERASVWEMKNRSKLEELRTVNQDLQITKSNEEWLKQEKTLLEYDNEIKSAESRHFRQKVQQLETLLKEPLNTAKMTVMNQERDLNKRREDLDEALQAAIQDRSAAQLDRAAAAEERAKADKYAKDAVQSRKVKEEKFDAYIAAERERVEQRDRAVAESALQLNDKLKKAWLRQIRESEVLVRELRRKGIKLGDEVVGEAVREEGNREGKRIFEDVVAGEGVALGGYEDEEGDNEVDEQMYDS